MKHLPNGTVTLIIILVGIFLIYQSGIINKAVSIAENAANRNSEAVLKAKKAFQQKIADKDKKITVDSQKVANLSSSINQLKVQNSGLLATLASAKTSQDTISAQKNIITNIAYQNDSLTKKCSIQDTIISTCEEEKIAMQGRINDLDSALTVQLESTKCKVLFFGCPTRLASYEAGAASGAIIILILKGLLH